MRGRPSTAQCVKCSRLISKRISTNILVKSGPYGIPKTLFWICNRCLPSFLDELEVAMPDETVKTYQPRRMCRRCHSFVGKYANYCSRCGNDLNDHKDNTPKTSKPRVGLTMMASQFFDSLPEAERNDLINAMAPPLPDIPTAMPLNWGSRTITRKEE